MKKIYFDNSATTQVDERVLDAMIPYLKEKFGNASSVHSFGQEALAAVDEARDKIANFLNCEAPELIFTSGATESNNIAIQGIVTSYIIKNEKVHIITSAIEHPSVLEVFKSYERCPFVEVTYVGVDEKGIIKLDQLEKAVQENTVLVSIMYANNEVGSVQPIKEINQIIDKVKKERGDKGLPIYQHVDAVQAVNYLDCDVKLLGVDFLSFSGHKIYAPKGVGCLYVKKGVRVKPVVYGGHHEYGLRAGTLNVPSIVGLGKAVELVKKEIQDSRFKIQEIKDKIVSELKKIDDIRLNGDDETQLPSLINVSFKNAEGESILMMLDMEGIAISTGSACSSGSLEPSHVLTAMGNPPEWSHGSIRISLGRFNNEDEIKPFIDAITMIVEKLRQMAPK